jgi:alkanesulfonate monooxygenase SsuD/methylene tetrahydromethanopterin reductase-like flavin-dependent oxidoreductase (luciferase family)
MDYCHQPDHHVNIDHSAEAEVTMRYALMIEAQQGLSYLDQLALARRAEVAGFEAFFRSDHYQSFPGSDDRPTTDAWTVIAGLARDTDRIGLGVLVSPMTFRTIGNFVKVVTTADEMSGGRVAVGLGAGWNEAEHRRYGFAFPPIGERADRLEDALQVLHGLWEEPDGWSFAGHQVTIEDARFHPKPITPRPDGRPRPPIIVGGSGTPRSYRLAARYADEFNVSSQGPEGTAAVYADLDEAMRAVGRDPGSLLHSAMIGVLVGRGPEEVRERSAALLAEFDITDEADGWFAERRTRWIIGEPAEARAMIARFEAAGVERIMLQDFLPRDLDHVDLLAEVLLD